MYILQSVMLLSFSATLGGASTAVIREPRHRPLLLVSYRTVRIRELPPPADWPGRSDRVPRLYPCRYAQEKLSVRESDRPCPLLAFCPRRISIGRVHHHRKRMNSIRRFRTKLTFRRNILLFFVYIVASHPTMCAYTWGHLGERVEEGLHA